MAMIKGEPVTGRTATIDGVVMLAIQTLVQAVRDARGRCPREAGDALAWLNSEDGRELAEALGMTRWAKKRQITRDDLPTRVRNTYFGGGS